MRVARAMKLIRAINILESLSGGGQGLTAGEAGRWANIPYSTSHRYMAGLRKLHLVERHEAKSWRKEFRYTLTKDGLELLHGQKELI